MSAARAIAAKAHMPAQAAPPAVQAIAPRALAAMAPVASLTAVPSGPAVQRKCAACKEEQSAVQPRLEVGPVGDRYEQEADSIAAQVMAMRDSEPSAASDAAPAVQRACAACSASSDDEPRARRMGGEDRASEEDELKVRARREGGPETIAASDSELTSGGAALPTSTRSFFETRMGRDLGDVRVHQGGPSAAMNASISARAFTYKNHVWLGAGETAGPSFTMAHELAHVMQQTAPGPVGPQRVMRVSCDPHSEDLFFAPVAGNVPTGAPGTRASAEQMFIKQLTKGTGVMGEVPIPNATKKTGGCNALGKTGRADLVQTNNGRLPGFVMHEVTGPQNPRPWYALKPDSVGCTGGEDKRLEPKAINFPEISYFDGSAKKGSRKDHTSPTWTTNDGYQSNFYQSVANAPTEMSIGEVKFGGTPHARSVAKDQIANYMEGAQFTARSYDAMRNQINNDNNSLTEGKKPKLDPWSLKTDQLTSIPKGPSSWTGIAADQQVQVAKWVEKPSVLPGEDKYDPVPCSVNKQFKGKLFGGHDATNPWVWLYAWYPNDAPPNNVNGSAEYTEYLKTASRLIELGLATPGDGTKPKVRRLPLPERASPTLSLTSTPPGIVRRKARPGKAIPKDDPFRTDYVQWKEDRKALSTRFGAYEKTDAFGKDTASQLFNQALKNTKGITGSAPNGVEPDTSPAMKQAEKSLRDLQMITGPAGAIFGELRYRLGDVFIKIMLAYEKIRDKVQEFFKKRDDSSSGGDLKVRALKVFVKILGAVGAYFLPRITDALIDCIKNGFTATIERWIDEGPLGDLEKTLQGYLTQAEQLASDVFGDLEAMAKELLEPVTKTYDEVKGIVQGVADVVGIAKAAFDVARAAACLVGGLETAGISCIISLADKLLGLVGLSPSEHLLAWLLESCPAQEFFAEKIVAFRQIQQIPQKIAATIIREVKNKLPPWLQQFFCDPEAMVVDVGESPQFKDVTEDCQNTDLGKSGAPTGLDRSKVDRKPTPEEKAQLGGFTPSTKWEERAKAPVETASGQDEEAAPPPTGTPSGVDEAASDAAQSTDTTHRFEAEKGSVTNPNGSVSVLFYVHGIGRGFSVGKYEAPEERDVQISFQMNGRYYDSNDVFRIRVFEVKSVGDGVEDKRTTIRWSAVDSYKLKLQDRTLDVPKSETFRGYLGKRR